MLLLSGEEYAASRQKTYSSLFLANAITPVRKATGRVLTREFARAGLDDDLVITRQRVGKNGTIFLMEKYRTLLPPENLVAISAITDFMRRTGLDETQQIENIRRREMDFVAHRGLDPDEHEFIYQTANPKLVDKHRRLVLPFPPGNVSSWGIYAHVGGQTDVNEADMRLELDCKDIIDGSLAYDLQLVTRAVYLAVFNRMTAGRIEVAGAIAHDLPFPDELDI